MWPVACGTELMPVLHPVGCGQFTWAVGGHEVRPEHELDHEPMASHGMKARLAGMLRRISSPASTANLNAHRM